MRLGQGQIGQDPRHLLEDARQYEAKMPRTEGREPSLLELMAGTVIEVDVIRRKVDRVHAYLFGAYPCDEACGIGVPEDVRTMALRTHINTQDVSKLLDDIISRLAE